jgi:hypothetical protein
MIRSRIVNRRHHRLLQRLESRPPRFTSPAFLNSGDASWNIPVGVGRDSSLVGATTSAFRVSVCMVC